MQGGEIMDINRKSAIQYRNNITELINLLEATPTTIIEMTNKSDAEKLREVSLQKKMSSVPANVEKALEEHLPSSFTKLSNYIRAHTFHELTLESSHELERNLIKSMFRMLDSNVKRLELQKNIYPF